jgi:acyl carrier protein
MLISAYTSSLNEIQRLDKIPVGTPAPSKQVRLVNEQGNNTSVNEPGEVVVSSKYIALSVISDGNEQMINEPEDLNMRTYFTGDLAKWNKDGVLEHLGRKDSQVKINGVRIDTHLIEMKLKNIDGIDNAVVIQEDVESGGKQLFAFLVGRGDDISDLHILKQLSKELRITFLPNHFIDIDQIPLNSRGKTDLRQLQDKCRELIRNSEQYRSGSDTDYSEMEVYLQTEWGNVLKKKITDKKVTFFAAGGDSLAMTELTLNVRKKFSTDIDAIWVFEYPTIEDQAEFLESLSGIENSEQEGPEKKKDRTQKSDINKLLGW